MDNLLKLLAKAIAGQAQRTQQKARQEAAGPENHEEDATPHDYVTV